MSMMDEMSLIEDWHLNRTALAKCVIAQQFLLSNVSH